MSINILSAHEGISQVLSPQTNEHLPDLEGFTSIAGSHTLHEVENYKAQLASDAMRLSLSQNFAPHLSFNEQLQDSNLSRSLYESAVVLEKVRSPEIRDFVNQDLVPLVENKQLLQAFQSMMVQG